MARSRNDSFRLQALQITDALLVWFAFSLAWELREFIMNPGDNGVGKESINWLLYIAVPFTPLLLEKFGYYEKIRTKSIGLALSQLLKGLFIITFIIGLYAILARVTSLRRLVFGFGLSNVFVLLFLRDRLAAFWLRRKTAAEQRKENIIIAGSPSEVETFLSDLDAEITSEWHIVENFDMTKRPVEDLFQLLKNESVSKVLFTSSGAEFQKVAHAVEICELQGVEAWIAASFIRSQIARPVFDSIGDKPMLVLRSTPDLSWELMCKDYFDRVGAALIILFSLPLWIFAWVGIRIKSPGAPAFFAQQRAGKYGRPFRMWKFRTMVANAEELLAKTKEEHGNQMDGPVFKLDRDPRIFPFGALLRKLSIDELPQLLNVVMGDMSLVGPRPLPLYEVAAFSEISHRRRLSMKPGITCYWQAGGRNKITSFQDWVDLDLKYIDNWSLWLDFKILLMTVPAVLFGKGAK